MADHLYSAMRVDSYELHVQDPALYLKKDVARFLWNFLALRTSSGPALAADGEA